MKKIDITEKLNFEENPKIVIKGVEYEVSADAMSMLKVMQFMGTDEPGAEEIKEAYETLFSESDRKKLEKLKLSFNDFTTLIKEAVSAVTGADEPGE